MSALIPTLIPVVVPIIVPTIVPMVMFALVASITPGPVNIIAASTGAGFGYGRTIPHIMGATIGFCTILLLMGLGLSTIFIANPTAISVLTVFGAAFLFYTSYKIAFAPVGNEGQRQDAPPSFLSGVLCQWLNPKAWIVSVSGISVFAPEGGIIMLYFVAAFFAACFLSISLWALAGLSIQGFLRTPSISRLFNRLMGGLQVALVVYILL